MVFRWNITKREQLGGLVDGEPPVVRVVPGEVEPTYGSVLREIRCTSARVLAAAGDSRLVFIGRSPESVYDYLTATLSATSWAQRPALLNFSIGDGRWSWAELDAAARAAVCEQFDALQLDPGSIATAMRPVALIDLICGGGTFKMLLALLFARAAHERIDLRAVRRRLRIVGITARYDDRRFNPERWRRLPWASQFRPSTLAGVSVPWWFWSYLGDSQQKVSRSNPPWRWADPTMARPPREREHIHALRMAVALHQAGRSRPERAALAAELATQPAMRHAWCRVLAAEIRSAVRPKRVERSFASKHRVRSWRRTGTSGKRLP